MQLILLERISRLGNVGDEVKVRPGYGRNFLLPQGKAVMATDANRKVFERRRKELEGKQQDELQKAQALADKMRGLTLTVARSASDGQHLYGSVSPHEIAELLEAHDCPVTTRQVLVDEAIKTVGNHAFRVRLHPDVTVELSIQVEAEHD
ncbi:MAG TPA: 50S ribosomal protein L9 [Mariprofundaceae bacterium]|nr:50S ribosomal protein L9 [Mariprofundaceae bacterium]